MVKVGDIKVSNGFEKTYAFSGNHISGFVSIHNSSLGNPLGGTRKWDYFSVDEGLEDALNLSKAMTLKYGMTSLPFGGGKSVIVKWSGDREKDMAEYGEVLNKLNADLLSTTGRYFITGEDIGFSIEDADELRNHTDSKYVVGSTSGSGDPSEFTSKGVYESMKICALKKFGRTNLDGIRVGVQGLGKTGSNLVKMLVENDAWITATDIDKSKVEKEREKYQWNLNVQILEGEKFLEKEIDIFAPCAKGEVVNNEFLKNCSAKIICGTANNPLVKKEISAKLHERGILYAPDFIVNSAGAIRVGVEALSGKEFNEDLFRSEVEQIPLRFNDVLREASSEQKSPLYVALERVKAKMDLLSILKNS